ncbi:MAG: HD domain-containing protein [Lachnospiraceae bacterium]|nr:HD domain-containing protein [Lachnospiraceae bacterium]
MGKLNEVFKPDGRIMDYSLQEEIEHGIYVSRLAKATAQEMGLPKDLVYEISIAGLLHDIGKLCVHIDNPENLLITQEMKYVRSHARLSWHFLYERDYSLNILDTVLHHHENYDGTGYPHGQRGEEIHIGARIVRVCDVFAALTTDRPYRSQFSKNDAISMMIEEIQHFDLEVFLHFQRVIHRVGTSYQYSFKEEIINGTD